jgi:hypothetical protein
MPGMNASPLLPWCALAIVLAFGAPGSLAAEPPWELTASSSAGEAKPAGACNGDRFSVSSNSMWMGAAASTSWWWQARFPQPKEVGAILQVVGDHDFALRHAPRNYVWQWSRDGLTWQAWAETAVSGETRLFRLHRLRSAQRVQYVRLRIDDATGGQPALREVEFYPNPDAPVPFPDWIVAVNTTHERRIPGHGQEFIGLARSCRGWEQAPAQQILLAQFTPSFLQAEPRPLCAFLSGNFKDWCEVDRGEWRGAEAILRDGQVPLWASCGGAQGLALLSEYGVDYAWDCPHCRDPLHPRTPLYGHIGHKDTATGARPCGDYSSCLFEKGPHHIQFTGQDPVFRGLPQEVELMESHCGQIEWVPHDWELVATAGSGTQTRVQCLRYRDRWIYAAQFHIEMSGTPEASRLIMGNFLALAKEAKEPKAPAATPRDANQRGREN